MQEAGEKERKRLRPRSAWFPLGVTYVVAVSALAAIGVASDSHRVLLVVATALTLPCGIGALMGLYLLTGLFNWVAAGFTSTTVSYGSGGCNTAGHCWSSTGGTPVGARGILFDTCIVALYLGAAISNILLGRAIRRRRQHQYPDSFHSL